MTRLPARFSLFVVSGCLLLFVCHAAAQPAHAQSTSRPQLFLKMQQPATNGQPPAPTTPPAANPADVNSLDAILAAVYDSISGAKGKPRNWDRFRSLFVPGARLIPTFKRPTGEFAARALTPEEFIASSGKFMEEQGFFEQGIANHVETFGNIAQVFSVYEGRHATADPKPFVRGINSIQLMNDGKRWWVVTIFWQAEDAANPLPRKYLTVKKKK
ncbi:MAG TPA: hypothetical protein VEZ40_07800 [Pyrinomonadaceae bacterium]|nr:hypothetical protein [Pyrinomonadaceae bacterium]